MIEGRHLWLTDLCHAINRESSTFTLTYNALLRESVTGDAKK